MAFNDLLADANAIAVLPMQDNAASTLVDDFSTLNDGTLVNAGNSADISILDGPTSYLPRALSLDGSNDTISLGTLLNGLAAATVGMWVRFRDLSVLRDRGVFSSSGVGSGDQPFGVRYDRIGASSGNTQCYKVSHELQTLESTTDSVIVDTWYHIALARDGVGGVGKFFIDGVTETLAGSSGSISGTITSDGFVVGFKNGQHGDIDVAGLTIHSRYLSDAELAELAAGPEPVNTAAPTISGTVDSGSTLTCTTGTWALPAPFASGSNGTITYTYQWYRADDAGGTGDAAIGGATNNTYTLQAADINKYVRCVVRGTNTGGFDADEDTSTAYTAQVGSGSDTTDPTLTSATIAADGDSISLLFDEAVTGDAGFTLVAPSAVTMTYASGDGTNTLVYSLSRTIDHAESILLNYTAGDVTDIATNALATISNRLVVNESLVGVAVNTTTFANGIKTGGRL